MVNRVNTLEEVFDFDQVMLVPSGCKVASRSEVDVTSLFGGNSFKLPVVPANMSTIIDEKLSKFLAESGYFYVMHRFGVDIIKFSTQMHAEGLYSSVSIGVQDKDFELVKSLKLLERPIDYMTVDIAHGDAPLVFRMVQAIKTISPSTFVIAGNVATPDAVRRLEGAGADAIKVGIGPGAACLTSPHTGFGTKGWQLSAVQWCAEAAKTSKIIADGGIRNHGDVAKAIAFGADMVMVGNLFAGHDESPGGLQEVNGKLYKMFFGSASAEQKGNSKNVEGRSMLVDYRGPLSDTLLALHDNLQSAVSYAGGTILEDLRYSSYVILK